MLSSFFDALGNASATAFSKACTCSIACTKHQTNLCGLLSELCNQTNYKREKHTESMKQMKRKTLKNMRRNIDQSYTVGMEIKSNYTMSLDIYKVYK